MVFDASELLNFLKSSPVLRTIQVRIEAGVELGNVPRELVVVLPNVDTFTLVVHRATGVYDIATHISCPHARHTLLQQEVAGETVNPDLEILPASASLKAIVHQHTRSPVEEVALDIDFALEPRITGSLAFRSSDTTVIVFGFQILVINDEEDDGEEDLRMPGEGVGCENFRQASRAIRDHPQLSNVKIVHIAYQEFFEDNRRLKRVVKEFGRLFESLGPIDMLSICGCDPRSYLTPFFPYLRRVERSIVYPTIKELRVLRPMTVYGGEACLVVILELAKSQHARGVPFERVTISMKNPPAAIVERLRPWVRTAVSCDEEMC